MPIYDETFYREQQQGSLASAERVVARLLEYVQPQSVIDIGCGVGAWLAAWSRQGVSEIRGVDGEHVRSAMLMIPRDRFVAHDLAQPYSESRQYDLAMSLEVAEHLPPTCSEVLVKTLTDLSPLVLFSAAIPNQAGTQHINTQWQGTWAERFRARRYVALDCLRRQLWDDPDVEVWYAQNTILYVHEGVFALNTRLAAERARGCGMPLNVVHPAISLLLADNANADRIGVRRAIQLVGRSITRRIKRQFTIAAR